MSHGVKNISLGCGVRASLMLFSISDSSFTFSRFCARASWGSVVLNSSIAVLYCPCFLPGLMFMIMSTPLGGGYIIFAFSAVRCPISGVRCPASRMVSAHLKEKY